MLYQYRVIIFWKCRRYRKIIHCHYYNHNGIYMKLSIVVLNFAFFCKLFYNIVKNTKFKIDSFETQKGNLNDIESSKYYQCVSGNQFKNKRLWQKKKIDERDTVNEISYFYSWAN